MTGAVPRLSLIVVAQDEEQDLPACLDSARFVDEAIVVDSGSRDATREIARARGARVLENPWPGDGPQRQFALEHATGDWVLNLDADERLSPSLVPEIQKAIERPEIDGYYLRFQTVFLGRRLRFGAALGERHLRLFRRSRARFNDLEVHGGVRVDGRVGILSNPVIHDSYRNLDEYFRKFNAYTTAMARQRRAAGVSFSPFSALRLPWRFLTRYVLRGGFLDGYAGFAYASLGSFYDFVKYAKLWDLENAHSDDAVLGVGNRTRRSLPQ